MIQSSGFHDEYNLVETEALTEITPARADAIDANLSGSEAGHSRVKVKKIDDENKYARIKEGMDKFGLDGLVISGGDDSGSVMVDLFENGIKAADLDAFITFLARIFVDFRHIAG